MKIAAKIALMPKAIQAGMTIIARHLTAAYGPNIMIVPNLSMKMKRMPIIYC